MTKLQPNTKRLAAAFAAKRARKLRAPEVRAGVSSLLRAGVACLVALCLVTVLALQDLTDVLNIGPTIDLPELHTLAQYDRADHHSWRAKSAVVRPGGAKPA